MVQRADGTGDIRIGEHGYSRRYYGRSSFFPRYADSSAELVLWNLPDVNQVHYRLTTAVNQARRANAL